MRKLTYLLILPFFLIGCKNQQSIDQQTIENYISAHHLNAVAEPNGLYYVPVANGTGSPASSASQVTITYKGYLTNDSVFDAANNYSTPLVDALQGWQEGIPLMQRGGRCTLLIPSALAFGTSGQAEEAGYNTGVPPNSVVIYDIYLLNYQ